MTEKTLATLSLLFKDVLCYCKEILNLLEQQLESCTNDDYIVSIQRDIITINNLINIVQAVETDTANFKIGASTELLLRIAVNDFQRKLELIPEERKLQVKIMETLEIIHNEVKSFLVKK